MSAVSFSPSSTVSLCRAALSEASRDGFPGWVDRDQHTIFHTLKSAHLFRVEKLGVCIEEPLGRESSSTAFLRAVESIWPRSFLQSFQNLSETLGCHR